jgi:dCTP deaminase
MSICSGKWIKMKVDECKMVKPFVNNQIRKHNGQSIISYGLSSFDYDIRVSNHFSIFTNVYGAVVDPKAFDSKGSVEIESDVCLIPPNIFVLALSIEIFRIPSSVLTICIGKSTYARCGITVNVTPFESGWQGQAVLEISNTTPLPAKVYAQEGLAQVLFFESKTPCEISYMDQNGKYQNQNRITLPQV